jgi:hypothetical protein
MRLFLAMFLFAHFASAQTPEIEAATKAKLATLKFLGTLHDAESGGYRNEANAKPSLRATNAAVKATKYLGGKLDDAEKTKTFVLGCYDDKTGAFAEPGGKPDVTTTCIGVMAAMELGVAKEKIAKAPDYIASNAKNFEEVRIGAAAVEAWGGVKDWKRDLKPWSEIAAKERESWKSISPLSLDMNGWPTRHGGMAAFQLRMGESPKIEDLADSQRNDGAWGWDGQPSDTSSTYRVMRALHMLKSRPKETAKLREFIAKHRNDDGGYATKPGDKSSAAGTYYAVIVLKWLDELEKK